MSKPDEVKKAYVFVDSDKIVGPFDTAKGAGRFLFEAGKNWQDYEAWWLTEGRVRYLASARSRQIVAPDRWTSIQEAGSE